MSSPIKLAHNLAIKALLVRERLESGVSYHPGSAEILGDPYPKYAQMRQRDPVHRMRLLDGWALTRYKDCDAVLRDHARFSNAIPSEVREQAGLIHVAPRSARTHASAGARLAGVHATRHWLSFRVELTRSPASPVSMIASLAYPLPISSPT